MPHPVTVEQFEQVIDIYEKLTATSEFMEAKENGFQLIDQLLGKEVKLIPEQIDLIYDVSSIYL